MAELTVVGLGSGAAAPLTVEARDAIAGADLLCGYTGYVDLVRPLFPNKATYATPMTRELERCRCALEQAQGGKRVALLCSGDAGVYGMAAPVLELLPEYPGVSVRVVAGVTAALSGAALLGAPLGHDFCVVSLSDLLTPWETIERRLRCAAEGDFVLALYNPGSKHRPEHLRRACDVLLETKDGATLCGIARNVGRDGESARILTLAELRETEVDMFTTVFVGSSKTRQIGGALVTPRGYEV